MLCPKTKDDAAPLPDPFELPKNHRPDVEAALKTGCMTLETNKSFLSTVAASMFVYKNTQQLTTTTMLLGYPFMRSPTGKPCVSFLKGTIIYFSYV